MMSNFIRNKLNTILTLIKHSLLSLANILIYIITNGKGDLLEGFTTNGKYYLWHRQHSFKTDVRYPTSYRELANIVKNSKKFTIVGGGKTNNRLLDTDILISLDKLNSALDLNKKRDINCSGGYQIR
jgi:FAD/FMN-containing dehydrogenase